MLRKKHHESRSSYNMSREKNDSDESLVSANQRRSTVDLRE